MLSILSQDKKKLLPYEGVKIKASIPYTEFRIYNGEEIIGIYSTGKRALEIVQEIKNAIYDTGIEYPDRVCLVPAVYEMPED